MKSNVYFELTEEFNPIAALPSPRSQAREYADRGVHFVMVDSSYTDGPDTVNQFLAQRELSFPVLMDPESAYARYFDTKLTTTMAVIDERGRLRYFGGFPKAEDAVKNLLAARNSLFPRPAASADRSGSSPGRGAIQSRRAIADR
jgi:hypothetical protein